MRVIAAGSLIAMLAGCQTAPSVVTIDTPIPVICRQAIPERQAMPTESFAAKPTLDQFVQAATAELEIREAYEIKLLAALIACTTEPTPSK